ncbi:hypothetical protein TNCV_4297201 [Trichonephila clavipes]|nr:hypothetical protein TNCV_4297201 [Trichonephila clavipes]
MERVPLPPYIDCISSLQIPRASRKLARPLVGENLGHWSRESLQKILGRFDDPAELAIQYISFITIILTRASKEFQCYSPSVLTGD